MVWINHIQLSCYSVDGHLGGFHLFHFIHLLVQRELWSAHQHSRHQEYVRIKPSEEKQTLNFTLRFSECMSHTHLTPLIRAR
jgi:hypothetical protein